MHRRSGDGAPWHTRSRCIFAASLELGAAPIVLLAPAIMRNVLIASSVVILALTVACEGSTTPEGSGMTPDANTTADGSPKSTNTSDRGQCVGAVEAPTCEAPLDVTSTEQAFQVIEELTEVKDETVKPASGAALRPTRDLRFTNAFELDAKTATERKPACATTADAGRDRCYDWSFAPEKPFHTSQITIVQDWRLGDTYPAGVSCAAQATSPRRGCDRIRIEAGTVVRFQRVLEPFYFGGSFHHYLRVVRPCTTACAADELRCGASTTCMKTGKDFCRLCEGGTAEVCFCREGCGAKPDGAKCTYPSSDDTFAGETCKAGACQR